jgi:hypothetical protein
MPLYYSSQGLLEIFVSANIYGVMLERRKELHRGTFLNFLNCAPLYKIAPIVSIYIL